MQQQIAEQIQFVIDQLETEIAGLAQASSRKRVVLRRYRKALREIAGKQVGGKTDKVVSITSWTEPSLDPAS